MNVSAVIFEFDWDLGEFQIGQCAQSDVIMTAKKNLADFTNFRLPNTLPKRVFEPMTKPVMPAGAMVTKHRVNLQAQV
jgi:hypothetical protein